MKKRFILLALILATLNVPSFGQDYIKPSGNVVTENYTLGNFDGIDIATDFKAFVTIANKTAVKLEFNENLKDLILVEVNNGVLQVKHRSNVWIKGNETLIAHITVPSLKYIKGSSDAVISLESPLNTDHLKVELSGDSMLSGVVNAKRIDTYLKGDSYLRISGGADILKGQVSGDSSIKDYNFVVKELDLKVRGDSYAELTVEETMAIELDGDSEMNYKGDPKVLRQPVRGDSEIRKLN